MHEIFFGNMRPPNLRDALPDFETRRRRALASVQEILNDMEPGDKIEITKHDGSERFFTVQIVGKR